MKKKLFLRCLLILILFSNTIFGQVGLVVWPQVQCYSANGNSVSAYIVPTPTGVVSYSWSVTSPSNCAASLSTYSNGAVASINYSCCGIYTITCYAYGNNTIQIGAYTNTTNVSCTNITTNVSPNLTVCPNVTSTISASGANTYTWSSGGTGSSIIIPATNNFSTISTTCYSVTGSNSYGCLGSAVQCLTTRTVSMNISPNSTICLGSTVTLTTSGAQNVTWYSPAGTFTGSTLVQTPTASICYTAVGSNNWGCTTYSTVCVTVLQNQPPTINGNLNLCNGSSTTLYASGANSYTWYPGASTSFSISVSPTTTSCYTVVGNGCILSSAVTCVTVGVGQVLSVSGNTSVCAGSAATLTANGASTYTWLTNSGTYTGSTIVLTPTTTACYSLVGLGSNGCIGYYNSCINISPQANPIINGNLSTCNNSSVALYASGATNYTWYPGGSNAQSIIVTPSANICYTLIGSGCGLGSAVKCVTPGVLPSLTISGNTLVCPGNSVTLNASGAASYTWYTSQGTFTGSTIALTPTATTCYSLVGTNGAGCTSYTGGCIYTYTAPVISISGNSSLCSGSSTTLTATGASNYTWYPGGFIGSNLVVSPSFNTCYTAYAYGTPSIAGCVGYATKCVTVQSASNPTIISNLGNSICSNTFNILSASGATSYTWLPGGSTSTNFTVNPTANTCYTLLGSGCNGINSAVQCITVNPTPTISVTGNTNICLGNSTTLTASGAVNYYWISSTSTYTGSSIAVLPTSSTCYTVYGYNSAGCTGTALTCVNIQGGNLSVTGNTSICSGSSTTLTASGATNYTWLPGGMTGASIVVSPTASTCYTAIGSSTVGCGGSGLICVFVTPKPNITLTGGYICAGQSGQIHATGANTYTWLPFNYTGSTINITPTTSACYTVWGTSTSGCTNSVIGCYSVIPTASITISGNNSICYGAATTLTASGAPNYTWYPGGLSGSTLSVSPLSNTCYTVINNNYGCQSSAVKCLSVQTGPSITVGGNTSICAGSNATLFANGALSYTWLPGNLTGANVVISPTASICYTVVGTQSTGCVGLGYYCVQLVPTPSISANSSGFCAGTSGVLYAQGASTYTWLPFGLTGSSISITPSVSSCYTVIGSNGFGCTNSVSSCYSVIPSPIITVIGTNTICSGANTTFSAIGASSYSWFPSNTIGSTAVVSPTASTCYTVIGTNGICSSSVVKCLAVQQGVSLNISGNNFICSGTSANLLASGANTFTWNTGSNSPFITVTPSVSSCYTVSGTNALGCTGSAVKCISVQATPVVNINGPTAICAGSNAQLSATGAYYYTWNTGSTSSVISVSPLSTTVYTVTGSNGICSSTTSKTLVVNPKPSIYAYRTDSIFNNDSIICAGNSAHLYAYGANSYTWSNGAFSQFITVYPNVTTTYTVSGTNAFGCSNSNVITLYVSACTGVSKNSSTNNRFEVYPNPSNGCFSVIGDKSEKINYSIYDLLGKELSKGEFIHTQKIDLSDYANGTYIIRFEVGSVMTYKKLIIEKE